MDDKLTVVMFYWGSWSGSRRMGSRYIGNLTAMLRSHITIDFDVVCFVDYMGDLEEFEGVEYRQIPGSVMRWPRNLPKFYIHSEDSGLVGKVLLFDLDTIILNNIDDFVSYEPNGHICGIKPFKVVNQKHGWLPGGVLSFHGGWWTDLFDRVKNNTVKIAARSDGGKERLAYRFLLSSENKRYWQDVLPGKLVSYKRHCKRLGHTDEIGVFHSNIPEGCSIIAFHGKPQPHMLEGEDKRVYSLWDWI